MIRRRGEQPENLNAVKCELSSRRFRQLKASDLERLAEDMLGVRCRALQDSLGNEIALMRVMILVGTIVIIEVYAHFMG